MTKAMAARRRWRAGWLAAAALGGALTTLVGGCAAPSSQGGQGADMTSQADEPENRRRARIRLELASNYYEEGRTDIALDEVKQVITIDPGLGDAYNLHGLIFMRLGDSRQAEESFRRAIALNPRDGNVLHNYGWLLCQTGRYNEANRSFEQALGNPLYGGRSKSFMAMGLCQAKAGLRDDAERSLSRSYELDAANPITGYNLANLLYAKGDYPRAQFYIRRLNNSELANSETLWLGVRVERRMNDTEAMNQLSDQLRKRFPQSRERQALDRRAFDE
jgi:type IV pilus assembly protein PilF